MVNQNHFSLTPLVFLVLIILAMCGALGMILGMDPFGPGQDARATSAAINSQATGSALGATETPQAAFAGQTALAIQMTGVPPAQTATAIAFEGNQIAIQSAATETAIAQGIYIGGLSANATATAIAQNAVTERSKDSAGIAIVVVGPVVAGLWLLGQTVVTLLRIRTQAKLAQARLLNEQRQLAEFRALHEYQKHSWPIIPAPTPTSLMKQQGNEHRLPGGGK